MGCGGLAYITSHLSLQERPNLLLARPLPSECPRPAQFSARRQASATHSLSGHVRLRATGHSELLHRPPARPTPISRSTYRPLWKISLEGWMNAIGQASAASCNPTPKTFGAARHSEVACLRARPSRDMYDSHPQKSEFEILNPLFACSPALSRRLAGRPACVITPHPPANVSTVIPTEVSSTFPSRCALLSKAPAAGWPGCFSDQSPFSSQLRLSCCSLPY